MVGDRVVEVIYRDGVKQIALPIPVGTDGSVGEPFDAGPKPDVSKLPFEKVKRVETETVRLTGVREASDEMVVVQVGPCKRLAVVPADVVVTPGGRLRSQIMAAAATPFTVTADVVLVLGVELPLALLLSPLLIYSLATGHGLVPV